MDDDGFKISAISYRDDMNIQNLVRTNSQLIPDIQLCGTYNKDEKDDNALFEEIVRHCSQTTKTLVLSYMKLNLSTKKLKVFPLLSKVVFELCSIEDDGIFRFNEWCPNITEIRFKMVENAFNTFASTDTDVIYPQVKKFEFHFENHEMTKEFMAAMDQKFPALEDLHLKFDTMNYFNFRSSTYNVPYEPLYFKNLKKLFVFAFGEEFDQLFDYMAISNAKLEDLTFFGKDTSAELLKWIESCKQLRKLLLDCPNLY